MRPEFFAPVLPRLSLVAFRYAQPLLIRTAVRYLSLSVDEYSQRAGYNVVLMAVVVYIGLAVSYSRSNCTALKAERSVNTR